VPDAAQKQMDVRLPMAFFSWTIRLNTS